MAIDNRRCIQCVEILQRCKDIDPPVHAIESLKNEPGGEFRELESRPNAESGTRVPLLPGHLNLAAVSPTDDRMTIPT